MEKQMTMRLQIGDESFGEVRKKNLRFVDKTLFIKEILDNAGVKVSLITRPRRFGKTFNLSTLHHFLAPEVNQQKTSGLFDGLKISEVNNGSYMQHQGKYPVIFISFKDVKSKKFDDTTIALRECVRSVFRNYQHLKFSDKLSQEERDFFASYFKDKYNLISDLKTSLLFLCELLYKHYGTKPWILIDEYDTPIQSGYLNNYYNDIVDLTRAMFGSALKDNVYLDRAVVTGILRISKESLFSGLNNPSVYSILDTEYSEHFGFTEPEVISLLQDAGLSNKESEVKQWYNGYVFGGTVVYNPWSIVNYINKKGLLQAYWVNTSDDKLIRDILFQSDSNVRKQFNALIKGEEVIEEIDENLVFGNLKTNELAAWSLLLMSGYLKVTEFILNKRGKKICKCAIPNQELKVLYREMIESWLSNNDDSGKWYRDFLGCLLNGDVDIFNQNFNQVLSKIVSVHDTARNSENFYHGFMLGLTASLEPEEYEVKSNKESGYGRYDLAILPKDILKYAIIFEFKSVSNKAANLEQEAQKALEQIKQKQYIAEAENRGFKNIIKIGLAFSGRDFRLASEGGITNNYNEDS